MMMVLIGTLVSCSGTKKGSGMESMMLNRMIDRCSKTTSEPFTTCEIGMTMQRMLCIKMYCMKYNGI